MEGVAKRRGSLASPMLAAVAREFAGSRVERQVVSQVFDVVWHVAAGGTRTAASSLGNSSSIAVSLRLESRAARLGSKEGVVA